MQNNNTQTGVNRRTLLKGLAATTALAATSKLNAMGNDMNDIERVAQNGNINHSVSAWCYTGSHKIPLDDLCVASKKMGIKSIELLGEKDIQTVTKYGLTCAIVSSHSINKGMNRLENHDDCIEKIKNGIDIAAKYNCPATISFSGNREGMDDEEGITNAVIGYKRVVGYAEKKGVTINIEYLNSKVNHKDYMFDNIHWGAEVCKQVSSDRLKILYDIYHAQIMEGDIIRTIQDYHQYIGHYHTGGVPGRNEIDDTQELYYPSIMKAIVATGYTGFVGQEFVPKSDNPLASLAASIKICDV
jgi:hydroxypyruvate isomerase